MGRVYFGYYRKYKKRNSVGDRKGLMMKEFSWEMMCFGYETHPEIMFVSVLLKEGVWRLHWRIGAGYQGLSRLPFRDKREKNPGKLNLFQRNM